MRPRLTLLLPYLGLAALVAGCGAGGPENTDPRQGRVYLNKGNHINYKYCDGTTLVYVIRKGGSVIPDSPECQR